jgi:ribosomal protein L29
MAQYIEEYNKIIKNTYSNNCEDLGISMYDDDYDDDYDYVPIIYIDNTNSLLPTLPHICDNQKYYKTNTKNILILGFQFLMKKMKNKSAKISDLRGELAELRVQNAELKGELAELRGELAELRDNLGEIISRMRS